MDNPIETEQSIRAKWETAKMGSGASNSIQFQGQDIFGVFQGYSYTCEIEMMGNAQICPLMYFQLFNVPMWRGTYMIFKVTHQMTAGNMVTRFSGVKMSKHALPFAKSFFSEIEFSDILNLSSIYDDMEEETNTSSGNDGGSGGGSNGGGNGTTTVTQENFTDENSINLKGTKVGIIGDSLTMRAEKTFKDKINSFNGVCVCKGGDKSALGERGCGSLTNCLSKEYTLIGSLGVNHLVDLKNLTDFNNDIAKCPNIIIELGANDGCTNKDFLTKFPQYVEKFNKVITNTENVQIIKVFLWGLQPFDFTNTWSGNTADEIIESIHNMQKETCDKYENWTYVDIEKIKYYDDLKNLVRKQKGVNHNASGNQKWIEQMLELTFTSGKVNIETVVENSSNVNEIDYSNFPNDENAKELSQGDDNTSTKYRAKYIFRYLREQGISQACTLGIMINLIHEESLFRPWISAWDCTSNEKPQNGFYGGGIYGGHVKGQLKGNYTFLNKKQEFENLIKEVTYEKMGNPKCWDKLTYKFPLTMHQQISYVADYVKSDKSYSRYRLRDCFPSGNDIEKAVIYFHRVFERSASTNREQSKNIQAKLQIILGYLDANSNLSTVSSPSSSSSSSSSNDVPPRWISKNYNCRDIGGWATTEGKTVAYGRVFRGSKRIEKDFLNQMGVSAVISLTEHQDKYPSQQITPIYETGDYNDENNRKTKTTGAVQFLIEQLKNGKVVYIYCDQGRDRTGYFIWALLTALGVKKENIRRDYQLYGPNSGDGRRGNTSTGESLVEFFNPYKDTLKELLLESSTTNNAIGTGDNNNYNNDSNNVTTSYTPTDTYTKILRSCQTGKYKLSNGTLCQLGNRSTSNCTAGPTTWYNDGEINLARIWWSTTKPATYEGTVIGNDEKGGLIPVWHGTAVEFKKLFNKKDVIESGKGKNILRICDIATLYTGKSEHQHGMMWNGDIWCSDYKQNNGWCYINSYPNGNETEYSAVIWRHQKLWNDSITEWMDMN
jgi:hypothetical protein